MSEPHAPPSPELVSTAQRSSEPQAGAGASRSPPPLLARVLISPAFWVVLLLAVIAVPAGRTFFGKGTPPPVLGSLPAFSLTGQDGAPFGSEQLRGKVWVANFIFTRCPTICPPFTRKMASFQERARKREGVHLVSFSVDPDYDTPAVLTEYATMHGADASLWTFLTGDEEIIKQTVVGGMKVMLGREGPADDLNSIFHGTHFVLVDRSLQIRGYYASDDPEALEKLWRDVGAL